MMRRPLPLLLGAAALSVTALSLSACANVDPEPTDLPRPPSLDGEWLIERVVTGATDETIAPIGTASTLYLLFTEEDCTETECTGTVLSGTSLEEREVTAAAGTYVSTADGVTYGFPEELRPCVADGGGPVIALDAYADTVEYTGTFGDVAEGRVLTFDATGLRVSRITPTGIDTGVCRPLDVEIEYELVATRGD